MEKKLSLHNTIEMVSKSNNYLLIILTLALLASACNQNPKNSVYTAEELQFDLLVGDWELQKTIKGQKAVDGGVTLDYITKTMSLEKGRFNTYTTSHIPWGSKYQTELKADTLFVYNGTQTTYFTFKISLSKDGNSLVLQNIYDDEEEHYQRKNTP